MDADSDIDREYRRPEHIHVIWDFGKEARVGTSRRFYLPEGYKMYKMLFSTTTKVKKPVPYGAIW